MPAVLEVDRLAAAWETAAADVSWAGFWFGLVGAEEYRAVLRRERETFAAYWQACKREREQQRRELARGD